MARRATIAFEHSELITAAPARVLGAFFDPVALAAWWQTIRSVTVPQPLGIYAVEWEPTTFRDEILGPLGGSFHGTVMEFRPEREFFVADAYWLPPQSAPLGPMALQVGCQIEGPATRVTVRQSGDENGDRWQRYYSLIGPGWVASLRSLKAYIEKGQTAAAPPPGKLTSLSDTEKKTMIRIHGLAETRDPATRVRKRS